jgi:hypothetical protein
MGRESRAASILCASDSSILFIDDEEKTERMDVDMWVPLKGLRVPLKGSATDAARLTC